MLVQESKHLDCPSKIYLDYAWTYAPFQMLETEYQTAHFEVEY